jgi:hypothetical protein
VSTVRTDQHFGGILVSVADWPIVVTEFPEKAVPDEALRSVFDHLESLMTEAKRDGEKVFIITDISRMRQITPASQRRLAADWLKRVGPLTLVASAGGATVTPSTILRGVITALFWLQPSPTPFFCVATRHDAMVKGIEMLQAARVLLSPRLIAYRDKGRVRAAG